MITQLRLSLILLLTLTACVRPPFNNFKPAYRSVSGATLGAAGGSGIAALTSGSVTSGILMGGLPGIAIGSYMDSREGLKYLLQRDGIKIIEYGDIVNMVIPTDHLYEFNSPNLDELAYPTLNNIAKFIRTYNKVPLYIAAFMGDAGTDRDQDALTDARAHTMLSFLWSNGIDQDRLNARGYGGHFPVASNQNVHGSAKNRRLEIQWRTRA